MRHLLKCLAVVACVAAFVSCHPSAPSPEVDSAAGAQAFVGPVLTIGADEASDAILWRPRSIAFLSNGNLLIADRDMSVREFDSEGTVVRRFGRTGSGPGEFRQVVWAVPIRGDSIAAYDADLHRVSVFSRDGEYARSVPTAATGIAVIAGATRLVHLVGFPLPVVRDPVLAEWGRAPILLVHTDGEQFDMSDTLMSPVWLKCSPANAQFCAPHPDPEQRRRGVVAVGSEDVIIAPARGGILHVLRPSSAEADSIPLPESYRDAVVKTIVPIGRDSAWLGLDHGGSAVWLRRAGPGPLAVFDLPTDAEIRAARGSCVAVWRIAPTGVGVVEVYYAAASEPRASSSRHSANVCNGM